MNNNKQMLYFPHKGESVFVDKKPKGGKEFQDE